ncbi:MAG: hypothetical protein BroJett011_59240 [Chloroflexota bacterium]|nr:MAG: hypothetical protein BroJett011_59240 [Chloroflexota bacterium]
MTELFFSLLILSAGIVGFFHLGRFLGRLATTRLTLRFSPALYLIASGIVLAALFFLLPSPALVQAGSSYTGYSEYYIPGPAQQLWDIFQDIDNNPDLLEAQGLRTIIAVTASADATTLYYDHWEDGYEANPLNPVQASSEQYTINEGNVQRFEGRNIPIPRATTGINSALLTNCGAGSSPIANKCYDGRDRIYTAGGPVVVTAAYWPESIGTVFAQAWEILPTKPYRVNYTIPVGEDLAGAPTNYADFAKTYVIVQSAYNTNTVTIDDPGTAGIEVNVTLNEGEVAQLYHIDAGTVISSTLPVQVQFITGDGPFTGASSWINSYSALPSPLWDNEYYSPVEGFSNAGYDTDLYIYNPNPTPITVQYQDLSGSGSFNVPAYNTIAYSDPAAANRLVPNDSGVYLISTEKFWAIGTADTEDLDYDWGFDLVPAYILDDEYFLGWAPGSSNSPPTENGSPVFVTPVEDGTIVYVDYSPTNGTVDATYTLNRLQVQKIFDPDNDNTGMHIWATGPLALMWGEDADTAAIGTPYLDMGYTTLPLPIEWMDAVVGMTKTIEPSTLPPGAGQVATVTLAVPVYQLDSGDPFTMSNLIITDTLPSSWAYVTNSTTISLPTGVLANNPAIAGQNLTWNLSSQPNLNPNDMVRVIFQMQTMAGVPAGYNQNCAEASGVIAGNTFNPSDCDTVFIGPLTIDKDTSTPVVRAGQSATYTIVLNNIDNLAPLTNLVISDTLPGGFTYAASTVSSSGLVTRTATTTPAVGATTLSWGRWDIAPLAILTITLRVNIPLTVTADTYDNTARASTTQTGLVDDVGTAGQDNHTPSGQDPESDEDVTVVNLLLQKTSSAGGAPVNPGDTITYTIVITNPGTSPQTNIIVADALPIGTTYVPQSTSVVGFTPTVLLGTVGDAFNTNGVFTGNQDSNGATDPTWVGNWIEVGEADGAGAGDVQVVGNQLQIQDNDNGGEGVRRDVDLSSCNAATLSLVYRRVGLDDANDYVRLSIGSSGTLTDILTDFAGPTNDGTNQPYSADISRWLSNQTRIQLLSSANMGGSDQVFFDDVLIQCYIFPAVTNLTKDNIPGGVNSDLMNGVPSTLLVAADDFDLPANSVMTVTYRVTVTNPLPAGLTEIENIASVTSDQQLDPLQAIVTDTIGVADLAIAKSDSPDPVTAGQVLTYTLVYSNNGSAVAQNVYITDTLPLSVTFGGLVSENPAMSGPTQTGRFLTWFTPTLAAGASGNLVFTVTVSSNVTQTITNSVSITTTTLDSNPNNNTDDEPTQVEPLATIGDFVWNDANGNGIQDAGETGISGITVTLYLGATPVQTVTTDASGLYTFTNVVSGTYSVQFTGPATYTFSAVDQGGNDNLDSDANPATGRTATFPVSAGQVITNVDAGLYQPADVTIVKVDDPDPVAAGGILTYTLVYTNNGPAAAQNVLLTDTLPASVTFGGVVSISPTLSGPTQTGQSLTWFTPTLAAGTSGGIVFTVTVDAAASGLITNSAVVTTTTPDGNPNNNSDTEPTTVFTPAIEIAKTPDSQMVVSGDTVTFTIRVTNTGDITLTNVTVSDPLVADCVATLGTLGPNETTSYTCTESNVLADFTNVATVTGTPPVGPDVTDNDDAIVNVTLSGVSLTKTLVTADPVQVGDPIQFQIVIANIGNTTLTTVTLIDTYDTSYLTYNNASPASDNNDNDGSIVWTNIGPIAAGNSLTITVNFTAAASTQTLPGQETINEGRVSAIDQNNDPVPVASDTDTVGVINLGLAVDKSINIARVAPHQIVTYTITITNVGDVTLNPVRVTDTLDAGLTFIPGTATPPPSIVNGQQLVWNDITSGAGLAPQARTQITLLVSVPTITGTYGNLVVTTGDHPAGTTPPVTDRVSTHVEDPSIQVDKELNAPGVVGDLITFTIRITNTGPSVLDQIPLFDSFTGPVQYVGGMPRADTVDNVNRRLTWNDLTTFFGDLAPGQSAALVTVFRLTTTDSEFSMTNTARVTHADDVFNNVANEDEDTEVLTNVPTAVDLLYFTSQQTGNSVELLWATAVEYDNYGFRLLRSSTGNFADAVEIGFVPGQGQGTVSGTVYEFIDATVEVNQTYTYWLVDVDFNGVETSHSETTSISVTAGGGGTKIYLPRIFK